MASVSRAVLITGCSTGIGRATAEQLAARGWTVYATARRTESIRDLAGRGCKTLALDVCDEASMRAAVETVERAEGAVGVLVNNAGYGQEGAFEEVPMAEVRRQFETNVFGLVRLTQLVLPGMRRQGWGRIVNLSSMGGRLTLPGGAFYHATKYAVEAISDALRFELRGCLLRNIRKQIKLPEQFRGPFNHPAALRLIQYNLCRPGVRRRKAQQGNMLRVVRPHDETAKDWRRFLSCLHVEDDPQLSAPFDAHQIVPTRKSTMPHLLVEAHPRSMRLRERLESSAIAAVERVEPGGQGVSGWCIRNGRH